MKSENCGFHRTRPNARRSTTVRHPITVFDDPIALRACRFVSRDRGSSFFCVRSPNTTLSGLRHTRSRSAILASTHVRMRLGRREMESEEELPRGGRLAGSAELPKSEPPRRHQTPRFLKSGRLMTSATDPHSSLRQPNSRLSWRLLAPWRFFVCLGYGMSNGGLSGRMATSTIDLEARI